VLSLDRDYTLPKSPEGKPWNKKLAISHFKSGQITERKLGYILVATEFEYHLKILDAENALLRVILTKWNLIKPLKKQNLFGAVNNTYTKHSS
jgi:hypothetical protein